MSGVGTKVFIVIFTLYYFDLRFNRNNHDLVQIRKIDA